MTQADRSEKKKPRNMLLRLLGPGLVTGAADDDPSGIATYSQAGAQFGYGLLWTVFLTTPFMIAIQLVSAQIGRVTGKGLAANVMELAPRWLVLTLIVLLVAANTFNIAADIAAMGSRFRWLLVVSTMSMPSFLHRPRRCSKSLCPIAAMRRCCRLWCFGGVWLACDARSKGS